MAFLNVGIKLKRGGEKALQASLPKVYAALQEFTSQ